MVLSVEVHRTSKEVFKPWAEFHEGLFGFWILKRKAPIPIIKRTSQIPWNPWLLKEGIVEQGFSTAVLTDTLAQINSFGAALYSVECLAASLASTTRCQWRSQLWKPNVSRCWQMSWGDTPGWEPLTLRVATVYKDPPSTLPGHPVLKSLYSVMVLFLKFQTKGQRAKTMSSQPQPPYQLWPLPCALFPCLCSCGSLSSWRYLPVLVRGPLQTRTMAPPSPEVNWNTL